MEAWQTIPPKRELQNLCSVVLLLPIPIQYSYIAYISVSALILTYIGIFQLTLPGSLKEEPHNENL